MLQILKLSEYFKSAVKFFTADEIKSILLSDNSSEEDIDNITEYFSDLHRQIFKNFGNLKSVQQVQQRLHLFNEIKQKIESYNFLFDYWKTFGSFKKKLLSAIIDLLNQHRSLKDYLDVIDGKFKKITFNHSYGGDMYIRFGKFPKHERSAIGLGREWTDELGGKTHEDGVSVYKALPFRDKWQLIQPSSEKALYGNAGFTVQRFKLAILSGDIYLVTGTELPRVGSDGEPLIEDIFPIKKLNLNDVIVMNGKSIQDLLEDGEGGYDFRFFKETSDSEIRKLITLFQSFINDSEYSDLCDAMNLSKDDDSWINEIIEKTNSGINLSALNDNELNRLKNILALYAKIRNKTLVFKGYRPFY